jgi:quercetin dioxygenase-like cupin family protein
MKSIFPPPVSSLPEADVRIPGVTARLFQGSAHQIVFMEFSQDADLPEHAHAGQWGVVLEGRIDLVINGVLGTYEKGNRYFIPAGVKHSGRIYAGYADITFFDQADRYGVKPTSG